MKTIPQLMKRRRRGLLVMDALAGIVLALVLLMLMTVAVVKQARRERELADIRTAARAAEAAMILLQAGQPLPPDIQQTPVEADPLGNAHWIRLTATCHGHTSALVGLVAPVSSGGSQ